MTTGWFDASYPPSVLALGRPKVTGATAGIPGTWTPSGDRVPAGVAEATSWGVVASPATAWTSGQYVQTTTAGAAGRITWSGASWVGGAAPLEDAPEADTEAAESPPKKPQRRKKAGDGDAEIPEP